MVIDIFNYVQVGIGGVKERGGAEWKKNKTTIKHNSRYITKPHV